MLNDIGEQIIFAVRYGERRVHATVQLRPERRRDSLRREQLHEDRRARRRALDEDVALLHVEDAFRFLERIDRRGGAVDAPLLELPRLGDAGERLSLAASVGVVDLFEPGTAPS